MSTRTRSVIEAPPSRTHKARKPREEAPAKGLVIWEARDVWNRDKEGYLVAEPGPAPDRPVALVLDRGDDDQRALELARLIVDDPDHVSRTDELNVKDLRPFGKEDSNARMPRFVFSLVCRPLKDMWAVDPEDGPAVCPSPWCKFLHGELERHRPR